MIHRGSAALLAGALMFFASCSSEEQSAASASVKPRQALDDELRTRSTGKEEVFVDRQQPVSENAAPLLEGAGRLGYRNDCLFLRTSTGQEIGVVIPSYVMFDGKQLAGRLRRPSGERIVTSLGEFASLGGRMVENPRDGSYNCDTDQLLIADYF